MDPTTWELPYLIVVIIMFCIVMARANATYWLGRGIARGVERTRVARLMETRHYATGARWLNRWGAPAVSVSFLTIGVQTMVNLAAGVTRMPLSRYLPAVTVGCIMWAFIYSTIGFAGFIGIAKLWEISPAAVIALGVLLVVGVAWSLMRRENPAPAASE